MRLGSKVHVSASGHKCAWAQACVGTVVWAQSCMGTNVAEPFWPVALTPPYLNDLVKELNEPNQT